jgi:TonB family protein
MKILTLIFLLLLASPKIYAQTNNNSAPPPPPPRKIDDAIQVVDEEPEFPGGFGEFQKYLIENINYPKNCIKDKIQGKVLIQLLIEKDGTVSEIKKVRSPHPDLFEEAARVIRTTRWNPAKVNGNPVSFRYTVPVDFSLEKPQKGKKKKNKE